MTTLDLLIKNLSRLPGLGRKSATRIAYALLAGESSFNQLLGKQIQELQSRIKKCSVCGNFCEAATCHICQDKGRDSQTICVVEQAQDVSVIDATQEYHGLYHVLHGAINPLEGVGPEEINLQALIQRCNNIKELIIATNPTVEGDTTAMYIANELKASGLHISRLAFGLPFGGDLEYADLRTLSRSLRGRTIL